MGIIYKLKPEVRERILAERNNHPQLSCRALAQLVEKKFQTKISKSSINNVIKQAGASLPVGRKPKKKQLTKALSLPQVTVKGLVPLSLPREETVPAPETAEATDRGLSLPERKAPAGTVPTQAASAEEPAAVEESAIVTQASGEQACSGAILLKAIDALLGGSQSIAQALSKQLAQPKPELRTKIQDCLDKKISLDISQSYLQDLEQVIIKPSVAKDILGEILKLVHSLKFSLLNGGSFYLDSQLHTVWPAMHMPESFSTTIYEAKSYIAKFLTQELPLVLFMAPDTDTPSAEFFSFLQGLDLIKRVSYLGVDAEELEGLDIEQVKRRFFVFGLWPWQFLSHRKVQKIGEFKPFYSEALERDFYLAEIEIILMQPIAQQDITIKGLALKLKSADKIHLAILSNLPEIKPETLVELYLSRWPNLEEAYEDFTRKIEFFTYAGPGRGLLKEGEDGQSEIGQDLGTLLNRYLHVLSEYFKKYFLPLNYEKEEFSRMKDLFYGLSATCNSEGSRTNVWFKLPAADPAALQYALARLNERSICLSDQRILRFFLRPAEVQKGLSKGG
ncbi:MAG: hypothetical protein A3G38_01995 [Omnitrophica WOR_2 bacterium RIFCSPLOWO2_12_FULL_51_8]|nr:MAG: hypothetical protein A3G38_01995 [Omnitrophica WOR_2 bacterium RIFCSPLOWO2_12_FULL_51_8]